ncbi:hypothetical protein ABT167_40215 [Streptomyces sp. NPDC001792]|uniref:hypothetical protein n=1 Tax=Streptomyces sp. NPDC001792 TaxID=3154524 RepID=UPI003320EB31
MAEFASPTLHQLLQGRTSRKPAVVDGMCRAADQDGHHWLFRGSKAFRYDAVRGQVVEPADLLVRHWPLLAGTEFADGIDACYTTYHQPHGYHWFFTGDLAVQYDSVRGVVLQGPAPIAEIFRFTGAEAEFARGIDGVCPPGPSDGVFWFFRGDRALQYDTRSGRLLRPADSLARYWPGLAGTMFAKGIDACYTVSRAPGGRHWFVAGDLAVQYDSVRHTILAGPQSLAGLIAALPEDLRPDDRPDRPRTGFPRAT